MNQLARRIARLSVVVLLGSLSALLAVRPELGDEDTFEKLLPVTRVVKHGPAEADDVMWTLKSMKAYTRLVDEDHQEIDLKAPEGSTIIVTTIEVRTTAQTKINDGFYCAIDLTDDRGNYWEENKETYGLTTPTGCSDDEVKDTPRGKPFTIAKVFTVPPEAVPHLLGVLIPPKSSDSSSHDRVLLTP